MSLSPAALGEARRRVRRAAAAQAALTPDTKRCPSCARSLPSSEYDADRSRYDGLQSACRGCRRVSRCSDRPLY